LPGLDDPPPSQWPRRSENRSATAFARQPAVTCLPQTVERRFLRARAAVLRKGNSSDGVAVARNISDRIRVMHEGRTVKEGDASRLPAGPTHPYTRSLLEAAAELHSEAEGPLEL